VIAADVDAEWIARQCPPGDLLAPVSPGFVVRLARKLKAAPSSTRLVLCAAGEEGEPKLFLARVRPDSAHPRIARAHRYRTDVRVYRTADGQGLLTLGRGLAGRWEAGIEVDEAHRNRGLGRALAAASRHLVEPGAPLFMQVAIGNIASLRSILAAGFDPVGTEVLFRVESRE
jgi:GNAT superfamily N-acetyltransferase